MQSDVPPLPISCLTDNICLYRNSNFKAKLLVQDNSSKSYKSKNSTSSSRKQLRPLIDSLGTSPYKNSAHFSSPNTGQCSSKSTIGQRVSSAKMLRIKQLQSQLADAHFHLNELSNENKLLKAIQKRQDTALRRYEGTNAELPRIINSHHEDLRVLQTKYKKLKSQYKETSDTLKEKENELLSLQIQNKKLLQLSKDRHLGEREKLQMQVFDLNHRINQQDEIIQTLKRKLALESKYLKHQLNAEMTKHKETQKELQDTQSKLRDMEELIEQRRKKSYHTKRLVPFNKYREAVSSQSLINLNESRTENPIKGVRRRENNEKVTGHSLPVLNESTLTTRSQLQEVSLKSTQEIFSNMTKVKINFDQVKQFHLRNSSILHAGLLSTSINSVRNSSLKESQLEYNRSEESQIDFNINTGNSMKVYELPKDLKEEFNYANNEDNGKEHQIRVANGEKETEKTSDFINQSSASKLLSTRLVSSATELIGTNKTSSLNRSQSLTKENIENIVKSNKVVINDHDSVITAISRDMLKKDTDLITNYSNSDLENDIEMPINFNIDEDDNLISKSDININHSEISYPNTLSHVSKLLNNQFQKPQNYSLDLRNKGEVEMQINRNNSKSEFESINSLLTIENLSNQEVEKNKSYVIVQDKFISSQNDIIMPSDDEYKQHFIENINESIINHALHDNNKENDINEEDKLLNNSNQETNEGKEMKNNKSNSYLYKKNTLYNEELTIDNHTEQKTVYENPKSFDKAKLLAAMKAIDDNENIEIISQKSRRNKSSNQLKITENLYRGLPSHSRKKNDIMKELFADSIDNSVICKEN